MLQPRFYYSEPPPARPLEHVKPTLLVSWWCTGFAITIILFRLAGRYVRIEHLFREDKIMALTMVPLLLRMGVVHVVLLWGTNNVVTKGLSLDDVSHREIGSRLVLVSRILYAATLWVEKCSIAETLNRLLSRALRSSYQRSIQVLWWFLLLTFLGIVMSTIGECHPFSHYWQVIPDPGPQCRLGYAQLATMGAANVITDLVLVALPVPIILQSTMTVKRKISLVLLFGLSLAPVAVTLYRIPTLVDRSGDQQYRTVCASLEILVATGASNALVLGSFVRDRGPKKVKFKFGSASDSLSRPSTRREGRMHWDSDEDFVRSLGMGLDPESGTMESLHKVRPAPIMVPQRAQVPHSMPDDNVPSWRFPSPETIGSDGEIRYPRRAPSSAEGSVTTPRKVSFFDVGGLLGDDQPRRSSSTTPIIDLYTESSAVPTHDVGRSATASHGIQVSQASTAAAGVAAVTQDPSVSCLVSPKSASKPLPDAPFSPCKRSRGSKIPNSPLSRTQTTQQLQDVGGLLNTLPSLR